MVTVVVKRLWKPVLTMNPTLSQTQNSVSIEKGTNSIIRLRGQWGDSSHNTDSKSEIVQASKH